MAEHGLGARASHKRGLAGCDDFSIVTLYCRKYGISMTQPFDQGEK